MSVIVISSPLLTPSVNTWVALLQRVQRMSTTTGTFGLPSDRNCRARGRGHESPIGCLSYGPSRDDEAPETGGEI